MRKKAPEACAKALYEAHKDWCMKSEEPDYWGRWDDWGVTVDLIKDEYYAMAHDVLTWKIDQLRR